MTTYLTIITTVLVLTQIIRITQNILLFRREKEIKKTIGLIKDNDVSEIDSKIQREVFDFLYEKLKKD